MYYHYTTFETLLKILDNVAIIDEIPYVHLRTTRIDKVNDPTEMSISQAALYSLVAEYERENNVDSVLRLSEKIRALTEDEYNDIQDTEKKEHVPYVVCFSKTKDYLPMWSLYGDKHKGVCLCFSDEIIYKIQGCNNLYITSGDVAYHDYIDAGPVKQSLSLFYEKFIRDKEGLSDDTISELILEISPYIKNKNYEYENEFRICVYNYKERVEEKFIYYENNQPFINIFVPIEYLKYIILGNKLPFNITKTLLADYFTKSNYNIGILPSDIPFK